MTLGRSSDAYQLSHPFREPLRFIVIAVMSVMGGTFPFTYRVFYDTINRWRVRGPSHHRHDYRHRRNALPERLSRYRDGHDAHDGLLRAHSRQGMRRYFVGSLLSCQPNPTNPTHGTRSPVPMRSLRPLAASGLSNLPDNPTLLSDEKDGPSSGW
jgi:hypothetical protein